MNDEQTEKRRALVVKMKSDGQSDADIALAIGRSEGTVRRILRDSGNGSNRKWGPGHCSIDYEQVATLYLSGFSTTEVAKYFGVKAPTISYALKKLGIPPRSISDARSLVSRGSRTISNGYVFIRVAKGVRKREHVLVAERALARELKDGEHVHHINCNPFDNRPENLLICTHEYHMSLHHRMRKDPYWSQFERKNHYVNP